MTARPDSQELNREVLETTLKRRFFYAPAFEIYDGVSGLYDYGPPGCSLQTKILDIWRDHFVFEDDMLEIDTTMLTPYQVLKTSGHVDKFADWVSRDLATGEIFRADHLIEEVLEARIEGDKKARGKESINSNEDKKRKKKVKEIACVKLDESILAEYQNILAKIDGFSGTELGDIMEKHNIVNPVTGGPLERPIEFNLMFETAIGPSGKLRGFLRPETAQGHFLNFNKLLEANNTKMPFASASIGKSFRNEISPRSGLLRVREFTMAEIEHFVDPENKLHPRFNEFKHIVLKFLPKDVQELGKTQTLSIPVGEALSIGLVDNETLAYFLARIYLFLIRIGIDPDKIRFRQHMNNEMAHYAADCWDAELLTTYGWIECVGCADRSAYDLSVHEAKTKVKLKVQQKLTSPINEEKYICEYDRKKFGPLLKKNAKPVEEWFESRTQCELETLSKSLIETGKVILPSDIPNAQDMKDVSIPQGVVNIIKKQFTTYVREYTPNVIEPSFGIGRILYTLLEHSFWTRPEDSSRGVFSFPPCVAPTNVLVVPLSNQQTFIPYIHKITHHLRQARLSSKVDDSSASIGKRYARNDEMGTPFGITVDFTTIEDGTVTLRERDSTSQVRGSIIDVVNAVIRIVKDGVFWKEATSKLIPFQS